jgi:hypothetical protein
MYRTTLALFVVLTLSSAAFAQTANPYNGTWAILLEGFERAKVEGTLTVKDEGGTWSTTASARLDPCIGRDTPITVQAAAAEELAFKVNRSQVLTGCPDFAFKFKKVDEKTMKAELTGGRSVTLTRK